MTETLPSNGPLPGVVQRTLADGSVEELLREEPLVIDVGGAQVVTMRTPGDDVALAVGFLLTEGVVARADAVTSWSATPGDPAALRADELALHVSTPPEGFRGRLTRTHEIRSSCGLCGMANPEELLDGMPPLLPGIPRLALRRLPELQAEFARVQPHFRSTGASHAAALFAEDGSLVASGEDVGRHNALDKAIGRAALAGADLWRCAALLSGRAGFDLVLKCLRVRIAVVLSVSAATAHSVDLCTAAGATLLGFVRHDRYKVYVAAGRLD